MKAAQITEYGDVAQININEIEVPSPALNQVLIEVHASSINPFDLLVLGGHVKEVMPLNLPATIGGDIAGVVTAIGDEVTDFTIGDKVYGHANAVAGNSGAFAESAVTKTSQIAKMPNNIDFAQAAALPLVGVSALQALITHINLQSGQKIFIHGGSGGIGTIAIQVAKHIGAHVAATASGSGLELVKKLGTDEVIDYKTQDFTELLKDYDAVFNTVGGDEFGRTLAVLKHGAIAVSMTGDADKSLADKYGVTTIAQGTHTNTEMLAKLAELVEANIVSPQIDKEFLLDQIQDAFKYFQSGSINGKVVIRCNI